MDQRTPKHVWQKAKTIRRNPTLFWLHNDAELANFGVVRSIERAYVRALCSDSPWLPLGQDDPDQRDHPACGDKQQDCGDESMHAGVGSQPERIQGCYPPDS